MQNNQLKVFLAPLILPHEIIAGLQGLSPCLVLRISEDPE